MQIYEVARIRGRWKNLKRGPSVKAPPTTIVLRPWQERASLILGSSAHRNINAPTGSGKTKLSLYLTMRRLLADARLKVIFAVPQSVIAPGFLRGDFMVGENKVQWCIPEEHNLCDEDLDIDSNVLSLKEFLDARHDQSPLALGERAIICTHSCLRLLFKELKESRGTNKLKNLILWIDESHHVSGAKLDGIEAYEWNQLGTLVKFFLENDRDNNLSVNLMTASFFRGDRLPIIPRAYLGKFDKFSLPYDEYLSEMEHLESFSINFVMYGLDYVEAIKAVLEERQDSKAIVYVPVTNSKFSKGDKYEEAEQVIACFGRRARNMGDHVVVESDNGRKVIMNLVDERNRREKKAYLAKDDGEFIGHNKDALDAVVAMSMAKEGFDWPWADTSIVVGPRNSLTEAIQVIGRLLRDTEGKKHVEFFMLIPETLDSRRNEEKHKEQLNDWLKAIYLSMDIVDVLNPAKIKVKLPGGGGKKRRTEFLPLTHYLPDETIRMALKEQAMKIIVDVYDSADEISNKDAFAKYEDRLSIILAEQGVVEEHHHWIALHLWTSYVRPVFDKGEYDVKRLEADIVMDACPLDGIRHMMNYRSVTTNAVLLGLLRKACVHGDPMISREEWEREQLPEIGRLGIKSISQWHQMAHAVRKMGRKFRDKREWDARAALPENLPASACFRDRINVDPTKTVVGFPGWEKYGLASKFISQSEEKKRKLLAMPKGSKRPAAGTSLGTALYTYIYNSNSYDPKFDYEIRKKQPQWFVSRSSLPGDLQYWTMCGQCWSDGSIVKGCEFDAVVTRGFISPGQFHGVELNSEIYEVNKLIPGGHWHRGDFLNKMREAIAEGWFRPGIVHADMTKKPRRASIITADIMSLLSRQPQAILLVANVNLANRFDQGRPAMTGYDFVSEIEARRNFQFASQMAHWTMPTDYYEYPGADGSSSIMGVFAFFKEAWDER